MYAVFLGFRYLLTRWINLLCIAGVVIATWALVVVGSVFAGFIDETMRQQRAGDADVSIIGCADDESYRRIAEVLEPVQGIAAMAPRIVWFGLLYPEGEVDRYLYASDHETRTGDRFFRVLGIDWPREREVTPIGAWLREVVATEADAKGSPETLDPLDIPREAIRANRGATFAHEWPGILLPARRAGRTVRGSILGDLVQVLTARRDAFGLQSHQLEFAVSGTFETGLHELDHGAAFVDIDELRLLFGQNEFNEDPIDVFNEIAVRVAEGHTPGDVTAAIDAALAGAGIRGRAFTWQERKMRYLEAIAHERSMTKFVLFVMLVISMFLVFAATSTMVVEKTRDIGLVSALGATRRGLLMIFMLSGLVIAVFGAALGLTAGIMTLRVLNPLNDWFHFTLGIEVFPRVFMSASGIPYVLDPRWLVEVGLGAIASSLLFSFLPAWRAARLDPVQALRYE